MRQELRQSVERLFAERTLLRPGDKLRGRRDCGRTPDQIRASPVFAPPAAAAAAFRLDRAAPAGRVDGRE